MCNNGHLSYKYSPFVPDILFMHQIQTRHNEPVRLRWSSSVLGPCDVHKTNQINMDENLPSLLCWENLQNLSFGTQSKQAVQFWWLGSPTNKTITSRNPNSEIVKDFKLFTCPSDAATSQILCLPIHE